jgi:DNA repair exonuclease SbcCD ATPase subunit
MTTKLERLKEELEELERNVHNIKQQLHELESVSHEVLPKCHAEIRKSGQSEGYYIAIMHGDRCAAVVGTKIIARQGYEFAPEEGATLSFHIRKVKE